MNGANQLAEDQRDSGYLLWAGESSWERCFNAHMEEKGFKGWEGSLGNERQLCVLPGDSVGNSQQMCGGEKKTSPCEWKSEETNLWDLNTHRQTSLLNWRPAATCAQ